MFHSLRLELSRDLYHVTSRGDRRGDILADDTNREAWLETLAQCCERHKRAIHAWCRMTNRYHLTVETAEGNLSAGIRQSNGVYTQGPVAAASGLCMCSVERSENRDEAEKV